MDITLYSISDDNNVVNKNIPTGATPTPVNRIVNKDLVNPVFILSSYAGENYAYVDEFGRYYFVDSFLKLQGGLYEVHLSVDVLTSFKDDILNLEGTINRSESNADGYLVDSAYKVRAYKDIVTKTFPAGLTSNSTILITVG